MADTVTEQTFEQRGARQRAAGARRLLGRVVRARATRSRPVLDQIADERSDLKVVKLNIDEEPAIAQRYGVMSIPTLILFKDGEPPAAAVGAMPKSMLEERLGLAEAAA